MYKNSNKAEIEAFLLENAPKSFNIHDIARATNISPSSVHYALKSIKNLDITEDTVQKKISINQTPESLLRKRLINIQNLEELGLINKLEEIYEDQKAIVVFGAYSFGEDSNKSDIDIAIFTSLDKEYNLSKFEKKLSRKLNIITIKENSSNKLLQNIYNGIVLRGRICIKN